MFLFSYKLKTHGLNAKNIMLPTPPKSMFSMFSNFLVFFVYPALYTPHTVFWFLSFSLLVKIRQMSHKILIGLFISISIDINSGFYSTDSIFHG
jgi:hypothetical protein